MAPILRASDKREQRAGRKIHGWQVDRDTSMARLPRPARPFISPSYRLVWESRALPGERQQKSTPMVGNDHRRIGFEEPQILKRRPTKPGMCHILLIISPPASAINIVAAKPLNSAIPRAPTSCRDRTTTSAMIASRPDAATNQVMVKRTSPPHPAS